MEKANQIKEFVVDLLFGIPEKRIFYESEKIIVSLLKGTEIELIIN